jgi:hypothetical protein
VIINYKILKDKNLILQKFTGPFTVEELINQFKVLAADPDYVYVNRMLSDTREVNVDLLFKNISQLSEVTSIREQLLNKKLYSVILVDKPNPTAAIFYYVDELNSKNVRNIHYCSTMEYALDLLLLTDSQDEIEALLKNM